MGQTSDALVRAVVAGDQAAWCELAAALTSQIAAIARSHPGMRKRGLAQSCDDVAEVTTATLERLARDGYRNLSRFLEQRDQSDRTRTQSFDSWLYGATDFVIREHLRKRFGRAPKPSLDPLSPQPSRRDLVSNAEPIEEAQLARSSARLLGVTAQLTLAQVFAYIAAEFDSTEARAMRLYYQDECSFEAIAAALDLGCARDAEKLIRRLNARLRHRFSESQG